MPSIEIIVRGLCIQKGHILLCKPVQKDYYYLPGGHVEFGETLQVALQREWQEELGYPCEVGSFIQYFESFFTADSKQYHEYSFLFNVSCCSLSFPEPPRSKESELVFYWAPLNQLTHLTIFPTEMVQKIIEFTSVEAH